jgi:hypothetical protein
MEVAGIYIYNLVQPPSDMDFIEIGTPPYDQSLMTRLTPSDFVKGLLSGTKLTEGDGLWGGLAGGSPYPNS